MGTLTSANSKLNISVANLFATPQAISGYATDDAFSTEQVQISEHKVGVDGILSAGYTPTVIPLSIMLQANSNSINFFDVWGSATIQAREVYVGTVIIAVPALSKVFTFAQAYLEDWKPLPDHKKMLEPQHYKLICSIPQIAPL